jgi:hypothetical protein
MANEAGILLKQHLGLDAFPKVYYARVIGIAAYKIYFIFFDSRMPLVNLTSWETFRKEFAPVIPFKDEGRRLSLTNILPIEEWSGNETGSLFIRVDLCGRFLQPLSYVMSEKHLRRFININANADNSGLLVEDMRIEDFKDQAAISAMTRKFRTQRRQMLGQEIAHVKLMTVQFDQQGDWIEFQFRSISTPNTPTKKKSNQNANFALQPNPPKVYTVLIRLNQFFTWMLDTLPDGQALTLKDMKDAIRVCPVQFWSNSPAFHWQGHNYVLSQLDAAIYPTTIAPQYWNQPRYHGEDAMLDKHLAALIRNISFFLNNMTAMLNKNLQKAGIIGKVNYNFQ